MRASERPAPDSGDLWDAYALYVRLGEALHGQSPISPSKIEAVDLRRTPTTDPARPWVAEAQELLFIGEEIPPEQHRAAEVVERLWRALYHDEVRGYLVEVQKYDFGLVQLAPPAPAFVQPSWWAIGPTNISLVLCACTGELRLPDGRRAALRVARIDAEQLCEPTRPDGLSPIAQLFWAHLRRNRDIEDEALFKLAGVTIDESRGNASIPGLGPRVLGTVRNAATEARRELGIEDRRRKHSRRT